MVPNDPRSRGSLLLRLVPFIACGLAACASSVGDGEIPILGTDGKTDDPVALRERLPVFGMWIPCPAFEGCRGTVGLDLHALEAGSRASVAVEVGRSSDALQLVEVIEVDEHVQTAIQIDQAPTHDVPLSTHEADDPLFQLFVVFRLLDLSGPVDVDATTCMWDPGEPDASTPLWYSDDPPRRTIHDWVDADRLTYDVVDEWGPGTGEPLSVSVSLEAPRLSTSVIVLYKCLDGSVLGFEPTARTGWELSPDCPGTDDSGRIIVDVFDVEASPFVCPTYTVDLVSGGPL